MTAQTIIVLRESRRYAHSEDYLRRTVAERMDLLLMSMQRRYDPHGSQRADRWAGVIVAVTDERLQEE